LALGGLGMLLYTTLHFGWGRLLFSVSFLAMIPLIFHFPFWGGRWLDYYNLCLQSCLARANPQSIVVYYDVDGEGPDWESARALPLVKWIKTEQIQEHRLTILFEEGGFYCNLDMMFFKSFELLRHNTIVLGAESQQRRKINNLIIGAVPSSDFIAEYAGVADGSRIIPWEITNKSNITILKRCAFFPVAISNKTFWKGEPPNILNSYSIQYWNAKNLTLAKLRKSGLRSEIDKLLNPVKTIDSNVRITSGICSFD